MIPITFRALSNYNKPGANKLAPTPKPTGTLETDLMIAVLLQASASVIDVPAGWVEFDSDTSAGAVITQKKYWKIAGASEPTSYTWGNFNTGAGGVCITSWYGDYDPLDPMGDSSYLTTASTVTPATASLNMLNYGNLIITTFVTTIITALTLASNPTDETNLIDSAYLGKRFSYFYEIDKLGATGAKTATYTGAACVFQTSIISINAKKSNFFF